jgi:hypothetical protein
VDEKAFLKYQHDFLRKIADAKAQFIFISCHLLGEAQHFSTTDVQW